ncbi:MAG: alpha-glucuronidase [Bacteroidales bacterium]|nr:alpha-glucuronidase [Bacteroidales bacterium]
MKTLITTCLALAAVACSQKPNEYKGELLWLQYTQPKNKVCVVVQDTIPTLQIARNELFANFSKADTVRLQIVADAALPNDGFRIAVGGKTIDIEAQSTVGLLYGAYHLIRCEAAGAQVRPTTEVPSYALRILNHWDNIDGTIERGYAGKSLWQWDELPAVVSPRYAEYARANASIGINATVLNNVNASPQILSDEYIRKTAALADVFRPYGIRVYLSVNFSSPMALDSLPTADPLDKAVRQWWKDKADEIYKAIPDFGGFLVKANSEGLPGPLDFGRSHADGANMLAEALAPHGGIVMWRAFVYSPSDADRAKQAYLEFEPLDGQFADNVIIQTKNGPIDFQPREPFSPLFGHLAKTRQMAELQITQEYTGHSNHLCFLPSMWLEVLNTDTYEHGEGSLIRDKIEAIAGVSNVGDSANWCAHPFAQANWYAFGRIAWNNRLTTDSLATEWIRQTLGKLPNDVERKIADMMDTSHETVVDYMMPLGLHHIFAWGHHYGPEPWCAIPGARPDWMPSYYHCADSLGLGFDRSYSGSRACEQYNAPLDSLYGNIQTCPDKYLLWFHHVPWNYTMHSGRTMWDELCLSYGRGLAAAEQYVQTWNECRPYVDPLLWNSVARRLDIQAHDARWWHDACLLYFQQFSKMPIQQKTLLNLDDMMKFHLRISNYECPADGGMRAEN